MTGIHINQGNLHLDVYMYPVNMKAEIKMIFPQDKVSQIASKALEAGGGA